MWQSYINIAVLECRLTNYQLLPTDDLELAIGLALSSGIRFSRRLSPFRRDSQPELYPSSGESRCFLFSSFN